MDYKKYTLSELLTKEISNQESVEADGYICGITTSLHLGSNVHYIATAFLEENDIIIPFTYAARLQIILSFLQLASEHKEKVTIRGRFFYDSRTINTEDITLLGFTIARDSQLTDDTLKKVNDYLQNKRVRNFINKDYIR